jgi:hypothetical protein
MITFEEANALLNYNPKTGMFTWKIDRGSTHKAGEITGSIRVGGYSKIAINKKSYCAHRLAWLLHYKEPPKHQIDHIDRDRLNNKISNLRDVTSSINNRNKALTSRNTTGYIGVRKKGNSYEAGITLNHRTIYLGSFPTAAEASMAYLSALASLDTLNIIPRKRVKGEKLTQSEIKTTFIYEQITGILTWKDTFNKAGRIDNCGYIKIVVKNRVYTAHALIWALHYGELPDTNIKVIDHINRVRHDNRIENLRLVSRRDNSLNMTLSKNNVSGCKGVTYDKSRGLWKSIISSIEKKEIHLGRFKTVEEAIFARKEAELIYHV